MTDMDKKAGISPFANKVYEMSRNLRMTGSLVGKAADIVTMLLSRCEDITFLVEELDCTEEEKFEVALRYYKLKAEAQAIIALAVQCKERTESLAKEVLTDRFFGEYVGRSVVQHHQGVFSPDILVVAHKVSSSYLAQLRRKKGS